MSTWEQKPAPVTTWTKGTGEYRVAIRKARIGWWWVEQLRWSWGWDDRVLGQHWRPTERCAERAARRFALSQQPSANRDRVVSLDPEGEAAK